MVAVGYVQDDKLNIPSYIKELSKEKLEEAIIYMENKDRIRKEKCKNMTEEEKTRYFEKSEAEYTEYLKNLKLKK